MSDILVWLETAWYLWVALGIVVVVVVVSVVVAKMRSRGYERVPHYFRQSSSRRTAHAEQLTQSS